MDSKNGDNTSQKNNTNLTGDENTQGGGEQTNSGNIKADTSQNKATKSLVYVENNTNTQTQAEMTVSIARIETTPSVVTTKWNKIAIWTAPGVVNSEPQPPTQGWKEVDKLGAETYIASRTDILGEIIGTIYLNTDPFDGEVAKSIEDRAKNIIIDLDDITKTIADTADLAKFYMIASTQIGDPSHAMAGAPKTGLFSIKDSTDKAKVFRSFFKFLELGIKLPKTDTIKDSSFYGYTDKTLIEDLRAKGYSFFSREKTYAWLDSFLLGGVDYTFWLIEHFVNEQLQETLGEGYQIDKDQDAFDDFKLSIKTAMERLVTAKVINNKTTIPQPNETQNQAYLIAMPRAAELDGDVLPVIIIYYKGGRIFRIKLFEKLNQV